MPRSEPVPPDPHMADLARWWDALQLLPLAEEVAAGPGTHLRVLFRPAFHPPACLTLHLGAQPGTVEVILPGPAIWDWVRQMRNPRASAPAPALPDLTWAAAPVPLAALGAFQAAVAGIALVRLGDTRPPNGRDGLLIDGAAVVDGVAGTFAAWSPTASGEPAVYQVCRALLALGRACLPDPPPQTVLGQLQGYLHPR